MRIYTCTWPSRGLNKTPVTKITTQILHEILAAPCRENNADYTETQFREQVEIEILARSLIDA